MPLEPPLIVDFVQGVCADGSAVVAKELFTQYAVLAADNQEETPPAVVMCGRIQCALEWTTHTRAFMSLCGVAQVSDTLRALMNSHDGSMQQGKN